MIRRATLALAPLLAGCILIEAFGDDYQVGGTGGEAVPCNMQAPQVCSGLWNNVYGAPGLDEYGGGIAVDANAFVFAVGWYAGPQDFDPDGPPGDGADSFLVKLDDEGLQKDFITTGREGSEEASAVAVHEAVVVVAGVYRNFDGGCGTDDPVGKLGVFVDFHDSSSLDLLRTRCFPVDGEPDVTGIAIDARGHARVVGAFDGILTVGSETYSSAAAAPDGFVLSFDVSGGEGHGDVLGPPIIAGGPGEQVIESVAVLPFGFVVTGSFEETLTLPPHPEVVSLGEGDVLLAFFDDDAALRSLQVFGGEGEQTGAALATLGSMVFLAGEIEEGTLRFDGEKQVAAPASGGEETIGGYVVAFTVSDGTSVAPTWAIGLSGEEGLEVNSMAVGNDGADLWVGGHVWGSLLVGEEPRSEGGCGDLFVLRLSTENGAPDRATRCGTSGDHQQLVGLAADPEDTNVFMIGNFDASLSLGPAGELTSNGGTDILVAALTSAN